MSILDQIYNAPAQASHTLLGGALVLLLAAIGVVIGISTRNKRP
jgi:hypothetical protein